MMSKENPFISFPVMFDSFLAFKFLSVCDAENDSSLDAPLDFNSNDTLLSEIDRGLDDSKIIPSSLARPTK